MKKIAFYIESMIGGGAEKQLIDLVNHLDYTAYEVTVISIYEYSIYNSYTFKFDKAINKQVKYKSLVNNHNKSLYTLFNFAYAHLNKKKIYSLLIKEKYDIEIAYYEGFPTDFVANSSNRNSKKYAWLHTDQNRLYQNAGDNQIKKTQELYETFSEVIGVSKYVIETFNLYFKAIQSRVIYNGLATKDIDKKLQYERHCKPNDVITFLTVGRFTAVKGYGRLLKCFKKIMDEGHDFKLIMLGNGEEMAPLRRYVSTNDMEKRITFEGPQDNPYIYMKEADYYICSSFFEGYSIATLEAIYCELPVLTTNCSGQKEIFAGLPCGIICENSEDGIYHMLSETIKHPEKRKNYVDACRIRKKSLNIDNTVEQFNELINGE